MAAPMCVKRVALLGERSVRSLVLARALLLSAVRPLGEEWRLKRGKAVDGKRYGELTDLPDYSFLDGRPTPLGTGQLRRQNESVDLGRRIIKLVEEVDFAKENYAKKQRDTQDRRKNILQQKLKPKVDEFGNQIKLNSKQT